MLPMGMGSASAPPQSIVKAQSSAHRLLFIKAFLLFSSQQDYYSDALPAVKTLLDLLCIRR
jgi:hypothetical protein